MDLNEKLKTISQQIQSRYQGDIQHDNISKLSRISSESRKISPKVVDKYIKKQEHSLFIFIQKCFQTAVNYLKPFYSITGSQIQTNLSGILQFSFRYMHNNSGMILSNWNFDVETQQIQKNLNQKKQFIRMSHYKLNLVKNNAQSRDLMSQSNHQSLRMSMKQIQNEEQTIKNSKKYNQSLYFFIWGPLTLLLLTHLFHDKPFQQSPLDILAGGIIDLLLMLLISFSLFVYCKIIKSVVVNTFFQHLCFSSFLGLFTIVYSLICASSVDIVLIPLSIVYVLACAYLHINAYNKAIKPNLIELIVLVLIVSFFYVCAGIFFYQYYHLRQVKNDIISSDKIMTKESLSNSQHFLYRTFEFSEQNKR